MRLNLLSCQLYMQGCASLKDKRRIIKGIKDRLRARMNVSVAEVEHLDKWQRSTLAVAWVAVNGSLCESVAAEIQELILLRGEVEILKVTRVEY